MLTTEVINWCRSCVRELDLARRLVYHAVTARSCPSTWSLDLVMLRDPKLNEHGEETLRELAQRITDRNFSPVRRARQVHVLNEQAYLQGTILLALFEGC